MGFSHFRSSAARNCVRACVRPCLRVSVVGPFLGIGPQQPEPPLGDAVRLFFCFCVSGRSFVRVVTHSVTDFSKNGPNRPNPQTWGARCAHLGVFAVVSCPRGLCVFVRVRPTQSPKLSMRAVEMHILMQNSFVLVSTIKSNCAGISWGTRRLKG